MSESTVEQAHVLIDRANKLLNLHFAELEAAAEKAGAGGEGEECSCNPEDEHTQGCRCCHCKPPTPARGGMREGRHKYRRSIGFGASYEEARKIRLASSGVDGLGILRRIVMDRVEAALAAEEGDGFNHHGELTCGCKVFHSRSGDGTPHIWEVTYCETHAPAPVRTPAGEALATDVYMGNSVRRWYDKAKAYGDMVFGVNPILGAREGEKTCDAAKRIMAELSTYRPAPPGPSPAPPTWPALECEDCEGTGSLGVSTVDTSSGPSGRKIACETCGGNEDRLGCGWIQIVDKPPGPSAEEVGALVELADDIALALHVRAHRVTIDWHDCPVTECAETKKALAPFREVKP